MLQIAGLEFSQLHAERINETRNPVYNAFNDLGIGKTDQYGSMQSIWSDAQ